MHPLRALISIGTNSTRLLIVRPNGDDLEIVAHETREPRIGETLIEDGPLPPAAVERTLAVIREYAGIAADAGAAVEGIATSALRRATDAEHFRELFMDETHGAVLRILSGDEEARFSFLGATHDRRDRPGLIGSLDVGGGSADFACGRGGEVERTISCEIGAVRTSIAFPALRDAVAAGITDGPGQTALLAQARAWAAERVAPLRGVPPLDELILLGGTGFTAAAILFERDRTVMDGIEITRAQLAATLDRLLTMTLEERRAIPFMIASRADIMPGGLIAVDEAMAALGLDRATLSRADLLYGYLKSTEYA